MESSNHQTISFSVPWKSIFLDTLLYELSTPVRNRLLLALSLFVFFFLILFRPFNLHNSSLPELLQTAIASGTVFFLIGYILNSLRARGYWVLERRPLVAELIYVFVFIFLAGLLVYVLRLNSENVELSFPSALQFQFFAFIMATVLIFVSRLLASLIKLRRDVRTRTELQLSARSEKEEALITLPLEGREEGFSFPFEKWVGGKAAGNYTELYFNTSNHKPMILVRTPLKSLVQAMQHEDTFFQCHRSYVVNLDYVSKLSGNSQAYKLELAGLASPVPVSRNSEKQLLERFQQK